MASDQLGNGKREMGFDGSNMHGYSFAPEKSKANEIAGNKQKGKRATNNNKR